MNRRSSRNKGIWIVAAAVLIAVVTLVVALTGGSSGPLSGVLGVITAPARGALNSLAGWMEDRYNYTFGYEELLQENEELKRRLAELEQQAREGQDAIEENERYRDLIGLAQKRSDLELVSGYITARGASNFASTMTLNKGTQHGVAAGNCVIDQYGYLVGVVEEAGWNWCTLTTVIDTELEMGGLLSRTNRAAILEGDLALMGQGKLKLTFLPENTLLLAGDEVLTSGIGGVYPSGLKVGSIEEIRTAPSGMDRYAIITPATELEELRQVFVITAFDIVE